MPDCFLAGLQPPPGQQHLGHTLGQDQLHCWVCDTEPKGGDLNTRNGLREHGWCEHSRGGAPGGRGMDASPEDPSCPFLLAFLAAACPCIAGTAPSTDDKSSMAKQQTRAAAEFL